MKARIEMMKEALAIAQKQLDEFKNICPKTVLAHKEVAEVEMGLDWTLKRVEALGELVPYPTACGKVPRTSVRDKF